MQVLDIEGVRRGGGSDDVLECLHEDTQSNGMSPATTPWALAFVRSLVRGLTLKNNVFTSHSSVTALGRVAC